MARLSLDIDTRSLNHGKAQVRVRINHKGTSAYVGTGVYVEPEYFVAGSLYDCIHRKAQQAIEKRERVTDTVRCLDDFITNTERRILDGMTAKDIREKALGAKTAPAASSDSLDGRMTGGAKRNAQSGRNADFVAFFEMYGESRRTAKTQESYAYTAKVLHDYCDARSLRSLTFDDIDYPRLVDFARWLSENGKGDATRHMMESYVRAAYKDGQKRRMVSRDRDPYFDYSIAPVPLKDIDCLTAKQMHALMTCEPSQAGQQMGRDVAMMSFYLCGANPIDLYEMREPKHGDAVFVRHKIEHHYQRELTIRVEPELQALVERYKGDGMMLHFKATYPNFDGFRHKIAHRLRELSVDLGFDVSMPKIRRTWATIAGELECPENVINHSMGHMDATVNRKFYERYDWSLTAKWNRKIIDYIKSQSE